MKKSSMISLAVLASASALLLAGCSSGGSGGGNTAKASTRACVILPDAVSSPRWENGDRPALEKAITAAGFQADIQNAQGDTSKYATIADQQLNKGDSVYYDATTEHTWTSKGPTDAVVLWVLVDL